MRYGEIINEAGVSVTPERLAELCQLWLDGGYDMTPADFRTILSSEFAQDCRATDATVIYRAITPSRARCKAFAKTGTIKYAARNPVVSYSTDADVAQDSADFTKANDEIALVFKKTVNPGDVVLDFTKLLNKLRELDFEFSIMADDDDEYELWMSPRNPYYTSFSMDELVANDDAFDSL